MAVSEERATDIFHISDAEIAAGKAWRAEKIAEFEAQYGMTSEEFLTRWRDGSAPDNADTNYWANLLLNWESRQTVHPPIEPPPRQRRRSPLSHA